MRTNLFKKVVWVLFVLIVLGIPQSHARVFTTRPGGSDLENPSSLNARQIYGGSFRVNGKTAEMKILAGSSSVIETIRLLGGGSENERKDLRYRVSEGTAVGTLGEGASEKRFLVSSIGASRSCLIFVLQGNDELFSKQRLQIPWPSALPVLDPLQKPQLVVEHLDTGFLFVSVILPQTSVDRALQICQEQLSSVGWEVEPMARAPFFQTGNSGFALLNKKGKSCWMETKPGTVPNDVIVTLLCKNP